MLFSSVQWQLSNFALCWPLSSIADQLKLFFLSKTLYAGEYTQVENKSVQNINVMFSFVFVPTFFSLETGLQQGIKQGQNTTKHLSYRGKTSDI